MGLGGEEGLGLGAWGLGLRAWGWIRADSAMQNPPPQASAPRPRSAVLFFVIRIVFG